MKLIIDIPKEFETDYNGDKFKDFFSRVLCDIEKGKCLCGSYEIETAEMFLKAFDESVQADDIQKMCAECGCTQESSIHRESVINAWNTRKPLDNIVEKLEEEKSDCGERTGYFKGIEKAINIVKQESNNGLE